jgi:transcriptional regulator with XRE-family HTH domain
MTGLSDAEHKVLARAAGAIVMHGVMLRDIADSAREGGEPEEKQIETLLRLAAPHGPETVSRMRRVLLDYMPRAGASQQVAAAARMNLMHGDRAGAPNHGIGGRIRAARREKGWTQQALADAVGVSRSAVAQWETDRAGQVPANLTQMAAALGTSVDWLRRGTEEPTLVEARSRDELAILRLYRKCSTEDRRAVRHMLERLAGGRRPD